MFYKRVKSISTTVAIALILGACSSAPPVNAGGPAQFNFEKLNGDYTFSTKDRSLIANLDGIKLLNGQGPNADEKTKFDVALEVQGVGVQFEHDRTYAYVRADRTFTNENRVGIKFRFQF